MTSSSNLSPSCIYIFSYFVFKSWANWMHPQVLASFSLILSKLQNTLVCCLYTFLPAAQRQRVFSWHNSYNCLMCGSCFFPPLGFLIPNERCEKLNVNPRCDLNAFGNDWWLNIDTGTLNLLAVPRKTLFLANELHFTAVHHWANAVTSSF